MNRVKGEKLASMARSVVWLIVGGIAAFLALNAVVIFAFWWGARDSGHDDVSPEELAAAQQRLQERPSMEAEFTSMRSMTVEIGAVATELVRGTSFHWSARDTLRSESCLNSYRQTGGERITLEDYNSAGPVDFSDSEWQQFTRRVEDIVTRVGAAPTDTPTGPSSKFAKFRNSEDGTQISLSRGPAVSIETTVGCRLRDKPLNNANQAPATGPEETAAAQQRLLQRSSVEHELAAMRSAVEEIGTAADGFLQTESFVWEKGIPDRPDACKQPYDQTQGVNVNLPSYKVKVVSPSTIPDSGWQQVADRALQVAARFGATPPAISAAPGNYYQRFVNDEDGASITVQKVPGEITIGARTGCRLAAHPAPGGHADYPTPIPPTTSPTARPR
ncbi:LppA family lipoprotein [Nocardia sp. NPDC058658]|uniref:LppA family lipoprotein n=1 Tax=Nocardia sp. NPDC058658 TaxID=3346580 RepID=UPI00365231E7